MKDDNQQIYQVCYYSITIIKLTNSTTGIKESAQLHRPVPLSLAFAGQSWHVPGGDLPKHRAGCGIYLAPFGGFKLFPIFFFGKMYVFKENYLAEYHGNELEMGGVA